MLSSREIEIVNLLKKQYPDYFTTQALSQITKKSLRTIQQDLKNLKVLLPEYGANIVLSKSKGYQLVIDDVDHFQEYLENAIRSDYQNLDSQHSRVVYILKSLLYAHDYMKSESFMDALYTSQSTINNDLKEVRRILNQYHLHLEHKPYHGLKLTGDEYDKRECIINEVLAPQNFINTYEREAFKKTSDIVSDCFITKRYKIDDVALMNLLMHIYTSMQRIIDKNCLILSNAKWRNSVHFSHDIEIADEIFKKLAKAFHFEYPQDEVYNLAIYIKGKRNYDSAILITEEVNEVIAGMLSYINEQCKLDLSYDIELRIALALHFIPLQIRLENRMQLNNPMLSDIKLNFTFAYELATLAGVFIHKKLGFLLNDNELSYLAIHFNISLDKQVIRSTPKRILILCSNRSSDSLLLKYTLYKWFKEMILEMDVLNLHEINDEMIKKYDVIFTTITNDYRVPKHAIRINYFFNDRDYQRIEAALHYGNEQKKLLQFFDQELFIPMLSCDHKEDAIKAMCEVAFEHKKIDANLYESVMLREQYGYTSFGNLVAIPHPNALISEETFAVTAILDKPICWGDQDVQLVFLICVEKENEKDLRTLFRAISNLLPDVDVIKAIIDSREYACLIEQLNKK